MYKSLHSTSWQALLLSQTLQIWAKHIIQRKNFINNIWDIFLIPMTLTFATVTLRLTQDQQTDKPKLY